MTLAFYDNIHDDIRSNTVEIDRIYCFDWSKFGDAEWAELDRAYRTLPNFMGYDPVPRWFCTAERAAPYLWASVEPPGLQVAGVLSRPTWCEWDELFRAAVGHLPSYKVE